MLYDVEIRETEKGECVDSIIDAEMYKAIDFRKKHKKAKFISIFRKEIGKERIKVGGN